MSTKCNGSPDAVMSVIKEDQAIGQIPPDVSSLDELDSYVDIDDYYRLIRLPSGDHGTAELRLAIGEEIGRRLAADQGSPWHVIWRGPGGTAQEVGKAVGYVSQEEAQAVRREHSRAHGGGFHLRKA